MKLLGMISVHVMPVFTFVSHRLRGKITSVSLVYKRVGRVTLYYTPMILYGMERTVSPAAHVAHDVIFHILSSN